MHATHDALRRQDWLQRTTPVDTPKYDSANVNPLIAARQYLRVILQDAQRPMASRSGTMWLLQLSHIKMGNKGGPNWMSSPTLNKKIKLHCAMLNQGHEAAAALNEQAQQLGVTVVP